MSDLSGMAATLQAVYRQHVWHDDHLGWQGMRDLLTITLCELMGDTAFETWRTREAARWTDPDAEGGC